MGLNGSGNGRSRAAPAFGGFGRMSEERPLDALLPGLTGSERPASEPLEAMPIHPRVLEVELEKTWEWAMACWFDPGPGPLRKQLVNLMRATLLAELSKPLAEVNPDRQFGALRLLVFDELSAESRQLIDALGFQPAQFAYDEYAERMAAWRDEAQAAGLRVAARPREVFSMPVEQGDAVIAQKLNVIQQQMITQLGATFWGENPGNPSMRLANGLGQYLNARVTPDRDGVHAMELFLVQTAPRVLRWMPPAAFQGLCDFVAVILQANYPLSVQWAVCKPEADGLSVPPLVRVTKSGQKFHIIPIALRLVDWCVMPRDEDATTLAESVDQLVAALD